MAGACVSWLELSFLTIASSPAIDELSSEKLRVVLRGDFFVAEDGCDLDEALLGDLIGDIILGSGGESMGTSSVWELGDSASVSVVVSSSRFRDDGRCGPSVVTVMAGDVSAAVTMVNGGNWCESGVGVGTRDKVAGGRIGDGTDAVDVVIVVQTDSWITEVEEGGEANPPVVKAFAAGEWGGVALGTAGTRWMVAGGSSTI